ncbi:MAG: type III pantothenate kinase, partial [Lentisphaeria bacterium]|nr:type III pantothenate kinase [Lentisphaeria bacterium]
MADFLRILNIGNTHVQIFESRGPDSFVPAGMVSTSDFDPRQEVRHLPDLAVSSVVPALTAEFRKLGAFIISGSMKLPFAPSELDLSTVGADRIANAAALLDGVLPALSIDFGTAVTFEFVTADRQFAGGAILPGRRLLRQALHDHTAQLPLIPLSDTLPVLPGKNTADALRIGTDGAAAGAVRDLICQWREMCAPAA